MPRIEYVPRKFSLESERVIWIAEQICAEYMADEEFRQMVKDFGKLLTPTTKTFSAVRSQDALNRRLLVRCRGRSLERLLAVGNRRLCPHPQHLPRRLVHGSTALLLDRQLRLITSMVKTVRIQPKPTKKRGFLYRPKRKTPTGQKPHVPDHIFKRALREHAGNYSDTAYALGLNRSSVSLRVSGNPEMQAFLKEIKQEVFDKLERLSLDLCDDLDAAQIRYVMDRLM